MSDPNTNPWYPWESREQLAAFIGTGGQTPEGFMESTRRGEALNTQRQKEQAAQQRLSEDAELVLAAQQAVTEGDTTYAEAAQALLAAGRQDAHDAVVHLWREEENWATGLDAADEFAVMDVEQYTAHFNAQQASERERLEAEAAEAARRLKVAQVTELQEEFKSIVETTPGAHRFAPGAERQLVSDLQESGILPSTPEERAAVIETSLRKHAILGNAEEAIKQQIDTEWRIHRRNNGARDGLMTAANIAEAEAHWKDARFKQLADNTMVDLEAFKPQPTAQEQSAALTEKYAERQAKSTAFGQNAADIAKRGAEADATRDRGEGISAEKARYREAYARAEETGAYGEVRTAVGAEETAPAGALDEYGDAFGNSA
jgi:hypothetical protein